MSTRRGAFAPPPVEEPGTQLPPGLAGLLRAESWSGLDGESACALVRALTNVAVDHEPGEETRAVKWAILREAALRWITVLSRILET